MHEIKKILLEGGHSLVIKPMTQSSEANKDKPLVFDGRGVSDLMRLLSTEPEVLEGAEIADKVVGKAAAALMMLGKVKAVYAETISEAALQLFASATDVSVSYHEKVDYIINRTQTGWCPMELATRDATTPEECLERIKAKLIELKGNKK